MMSVRPLPKHLQERAVCELKEVPSRIPDDINHIRKWINQQPHLNVRTEDQWILSFLRACKFSLQKTKEKLDLYHTIRTLHPEIFSNRDPFLPEIQECLKQNMLILLPQDSNPLSPTRYIIRINSEVIPVKTAIKVIIMMWDILLYEDDYTTINGYEVILDLQYIYINCLGEFSPSFLKTIAYFVQRGYPGIVKGIHFINVPTYCLVILNFFKGLLSKKISSRLHLYSQDNQCKVYDAIPQSILPNEYGGNGGSMSHLSANLLHKFESYNKWFQEDAQYGSDESKRLGKLYLEFFGMEGSFRKLDVD